MVQAKYPYSFWEGLCLFFLASIVALIMISRNYEVPQTNIITITPTVPTTIATTIADAPATPTALIGPRQ